MLNHVLFLHVGPYSVVNYVFFVLFHHVGPCSVSSLWSIPLNVDHIADAVYLLHAGILRTCDINLLLIVSGMYSFYT